MENDFSKTNDKNQYVVKRHYFITRLRLYKVTPLELLLSNLICVIQSTLKRTSAQFIETLVTNQITRSPKESNAIKLFHSWVQTVLKLIAVFPRIWMSSRNFAEHPKTLTKFKRQPRLLKTDFHDVSKYSHLLFRRCLSRFCEQVHFRCTHNGTVGV